jgi:hypothetical protein
MQDSPVHRKRRNPRFRPSKGTQSNVLS